MIHAIDAASGYAHRTGPGATPSYGPSSTSLSVPTTLSGAPRAHTVKPARSSHALYAGLAGVVVAGAVIAIIAIRSSATSDAPHRADPPEPAVAAPTPPVAAPPAPAPPPTPPPVVAPVAPIAPIAPTTIDLSVNSAPDGAEVVLDGTVLGKTPYHGTLPRHDATVALVVRLAGYSDAKVTARADAPITQTIKLEKKHVHVAPHANPNRDDSVNPFGN